MPTAIHTASRLPSRVRLSAPDLARRFDALRATSDDPDTQTVCLITDAMGTSLTQGANHVAPGVLRSSARTARPDKYAYIAHAEVHAVGMAARFGVMLKGGIAYLNWFPCAACANLLVLAGIAVLVADRAAYEARVTDPRYDFVAARAILTEGGVTLEWTEDLAANVVIEAQRRDASRHPEAAVPVGAR